MIACAKCKFKCKSELVSQLQIPEYEDTLSIDNGLNIKVQAEDSKEKGFNYTDIWDQTPDHKSTSSKEDTSLSA